MKLVRQPNKAKHRSMCGINFGVSSFSIWKNGIEWGMEGILCDFIHFNVVFIWCLS